MFFFGPGVLLAFIVLIDDVVITWHATLVWAMKTNAQLPSGYSFFWGQSQGDRWISSIISDVDGKKLVIIISSQHDSSSSDMDDFVAQATATPVLMAFHCA